MNQLVAQVEAPQPPESTTVNPAMTQSQTEKPAALPEPGVEAEGKMVIGTTGAYILLLIVAFAVFAFLPKLYKRSKYADRGEKTTAANTKNNPGTAPRSQ